tara:strand:- start:835 stop:1845 length:1011 start_codon:yes stop_codon:yes gene_type:complete
MAAFTTVAAGVGLATTAATTGASFAQAGKQRRLMKEAEAEAEKSMMEARRRTEVNYFEDLAIAKESYKQAYEAGSVASAQAIQAIQEGDVRGVAAGIGGIEQAALQQANQVRAAQEQEMINRQKLITQEDSRLRDINVQLDLQEVQGSQLAARDAQEAQNLAIEKGIAGVASMGQQAMDFIPLFKKQGDPSKVTQGFDTTGARVLQGGSRADKKAYQEQFDKSVEAGLKSLEKADKNYQGMELDTAGMRMDMPQVDFSPRTPSFDEVFTSESRQDSFRDWMYKNQSDYVNKDFINAKGINTGGFAKSGYYGSEHLRDAYGQFGPDYYKQKKRFLNY